MMVRAVRLAALPLLLLAAGMVPAAAGDLTEPEIVSILAQRGVRVGTTTTERLPDGRIVSLKILSIRVGKGGHVTAEAIVHADFGK